MSMADITHIPIAILLEASSSRAADFGYYLIFYESPDPLIAATTEPSNKSTSNSLLFTFAPPILQIFLLLKPQSQMLQQAPVADLQNEPKVSKSKKSFKTLNWKKSYGTYLIPAAHKALHWTG
jgi:hypothetical protein